MTIVTRIKRHEKLLDAMIDTVGVDIHELRQRGAITDTDFDGLTQRCRTCNEGSACSNWLAIHGVGTGEAPTFCKNRGVFDKIR